jgi:hypothetical protein
MDNLLFNGLQDWNGYGKAEWQFIRSVKMVWFVRLRSSRDAVRGAAKIQAGNGHQSNSETEVQSPLINK